MFTDTEMVKEIDGLKKFAHKLTRDEHDAEDLTQSTLLRAMEKQHLFEQGSDFFKWSSKIMYNQFVSGYRRKVRFESQYDPEPVINQQSKPDNQIREFYMKEVGEAFSDLSSGQKKIINKICLQGKKYETVAKEFDIPVGTVRSRLYRAREQLENHITADNDNSSDHSA